MKPAWSVILLSTLLGAGQGLFFALYGVELAVLKGARVAPDASFYVWGAVLSVLLLAGGLAASFFHLGHPERAWRAAAMWRTSWLSREVIVLPAFLLAVAAWGHAHYAGYSCTPWIGAAAALACLALFVCTSMIYIAIRFLREWSTPLTFVNFTLLGCASGGLLAAALAALRAPALVEPLAVTAALLTLGGAMTRLASLARNDSLKPKSTPQSATGIANPKLVQKAQGAMGGSFNTREFFHGRSADFMRASKGFFLIAGFALPLFLISGALAGAPRLLLAAFVVQMTGLFAERWFFLAQANHPQNIYYQTIS